jgi:hypothetical protein
MIDSRFTLALVSLLVAVMLLPPATTLAQEEARSYAQVRTIHVKSGMQGSFVEQQRKFAAAMTAAERPSRSVWQEVAGEVGVFHMVVPRDNLASFDEQLVPPMEEEEWQAFGSALSAATESISRTVLRRYPEYSIPADDDAESNLLSLRYMKVATGKTRDFQDFLENRFIPALKAAGAKGVRISRVNQGGDPDVWIIARQLPSWAVLDEPGWFAALTPEERATLFAGFGDMVVSQEARMLRYREELSF